MGQIRRKLEVCYIALRYIADLFYSASRIMKVSSFTK